MTGGVVNHAEHGHGFESHGTGDDDPIAILKRYGKVVGELRRAPQGVAWEFRTDPGPWYLDRKLPDVIVAHGEYAVDALNEVALELDAHFESRFDRNGNTIRHGDRVVCEGYGTGRVIGFTDADGDVDDEGKQYGIAPTVRVMLDATVVRADNGAAMSDEPYWPAGEESFVIRPESYWDTPKADEVEVVRHRATDTGVVHRPTMRWPDYPGSEHFSRDGWPITDEGLAYDRAMTRFNAQS